MDAPCELCKESPTSWTFKTTGLDAAGVGNLNVRFTRVKAIAVAGAAEREVMRDDFDIAADVLRDFPGKWEVRSANGNKLGVTEWTRVAGGTAAAGPTALAPGREGFTLAGWDPGQKKWIHLLFDADGGYQWFEVNRKVGSTYSGPMRAVDKDGKVTLGECRNKVIDADHFEITEVLGGKTTVLHFHRIK